MTKNELVEFVCEDQSGLTKKTSTQVIDSVFAAMQKSIKDSDKFSYPGFGTFVIRNRKARKGRDPRTGKPIDIQASKTVGFRPAKAFKEKLSVEQ